MKSLKTPFKLRRAYYREINAENVKNLAPEYVAMMRDIDIYYRSYCAVLYNFAQSGHPGGSISSGMIAILLLLEAMKYDIKNPDSRSADKICYGGGHKAMGFYSLVGMLFEFLRQGGSDLLPSKENDFRLVEDSLGFRQNVTKDTPLFKKFKSMAIDGHPTPMMPFANIATGASGIGLGAGTGLGWAAYDSFTHPDSENGDLTNNAPRVHLIEGEGGLTPGVVAESLAISSACNLANVVVHVDWNQSSIDSDHVCRTDDKSGDYVQWNPCELFYLHDWNVIFVEDGFDVEQVVAAQKMATNQENDQPTCIVYKTVKGHKYGIEGRKSHGGGHKLCSDGYYQAMEEFEKRFKVTIPVYDPDELDTPTKVEEACYQTLLVFRTVAKQESDICKFVDNCAKERLAELNNEDRIENSRSEMLESMLSEKISGSDGDFNSIYCPKDLSLTPGSMVTLRGQFGKSLGYLNAMTNGSLVVASADLLGSTSVDLANDGFSPGFYNAVHNWNSRQIAAGGITEAAIGAFMTGVSAFGSHIGVGSSYAAFIAAMQHTAVRLHCIGQQASGKPFNPYIMLCGHAGFKTGEDGPTHADPQSLQLLQENFPLGSAITLTPWDPQEIWPLLIAGLLKRPALLAPFVTRPAEEVFDREALGLAPATDVAEGVYRLWSNINAVNYSIDGIIILQGSAVTNDFVRYVLPRINEAEYNVEVYYVASAELFSLLSAERQQEILPEKKRQMAMMISDFTEATTYRWILSGYGRACSISAYTQGHYPSSGKGDAVMKEMGLDGPAQWDAIVKYIKRD